jgi:hypothetical protein
MQLPILVLGRSDQPVLLKQGDGYFDDDQAFDLIGRSAPFMPAGLGGECAFYSIYVTTTHYAPTTTLRITPRVDGAFLPPTDVILSSAPPDDGEQRVAEIGLSLPYVVGGVERLRYAPRGCWMDVTIETLRTSGIGVAARIVVDGIEVEFEQVQEGKQPV